MCYQVVELYAACRCLYYRHPIDRCASYGRHPVKRRTLLVGYACEDHPEVSSLPASAFEETTSPPENRLSDEEIKKLAKYAAISNRKPPDIERRTGGGGSAPVDKQRGEKQDNHITKHDTSSLDEFGLAPLTNEDESQNLDGSPGESDDDSTNSEVESVISTTSSTTTVEINATEAISRRILVFQDLRYLWPQIVRRSRSQAAALRNIERFIRRYALDLEILATGEGQSESPRKEAEVHASLFVRKSRLGISRRIYDALDHLVEADDAPEGASKHVAAGGEDSRDRALDHDKCDTDADDGEFGPKFTIVESFLFDTDPILYLQASVKAFVGRPPTRSIVDRVSYYAQLYYNKLSSNLARPQIASGKTRITWTCRCGMHLYDDFEEFRPGAAQDLQTALRESNMQKFEADMGPMDSDEISAVRSSGPVLASSLWGAFARLIQPSLPAALPRHRKDTREQTELGSCPKRVGPTDGDHNFVMLYVPMRRWATKLYQPEVCRINSDREFMQVLRHYYKTYRGRSAWARLRKVSAIGFVKFEVYSSQLVDIQARPSVPPDAFARDYNYDPMPAEVVPPIGPNHLMHLFEHPEDAEVTPALYRKIPKKLRCKLEASRTAGSSVGWGVEFVEGMNWFVVFIYGCMGFASSLVAAITWAVIRDDLQGAFAIAGFIIAFLLFCGGIARSEIHV